MYNSTTPMSKVGEFFLLQRGGVAFEVNAAGFPKLKSSDGIVYLTTMRLVFVPSRVVRHSDGFEFRSFEMPLDKLEQEKFNQPIFGANNLSGVVRPTPGMGLDVDSKFKISFNKGGAGTLLPLFFKALLEARQGNAQGLAQAIQSGRISEFAATDPNDPSIIYLTQPDIPVAKPVGSSNGSEQDHQQKNNNSSSS